MGNFLGAKHWIGFKKQSVSGTEETAVTMFPATQKIKMAANQKPIERKAAMAVGKSLPSIKGFSEPSGSLTSEVCASQPHFFYWALGSDVVTTPSTGVSLHTITDNDAPVMLTAHANRVYDCAAQYDAYISKFKLSVKPGEIATLEVEWMATGHRDGVTLTETPAFVTDVLVCTAVSIKIGGTVSSIVSSAEIDWDGGIESAKTLQTTNQHVVRRKSVPKITGKLEFIDFPTVELTKLENATPFELVIELQGDTISSTYKKFLRVTLPACQYTGGLDDESASDVITGSADFSGYYDTATGRQILVEAQNTISDLTA